MGVKALRDNPNYPFTIHVFLLYTVAVREPAIHLGNARLLEFGYLNVPADATLLCR